MSPLQIVLTTIGMGLIIWSVLSLGWASAVSWGLETLGIIWCYDHLGFVWGFIAIMVIAAAGGFLRGFISAALKDRRRRVNP
jgi:hypothetical protein